MKQTFKWWIDDFILDPLELPILFQFSVQVSINIDPDNRSSLGPIGKQNCRELDGRWSQVKSSAREASSLPLLATL